jgi:hypothetical protein
VVSDPRNADDKAIDALIAGLTSPFLFVVGALLYSWNGWPGIIAGCVGSVLYGIGSVLWLLWRWAR